MQGGSNLLLGPLLWAGALPAALVGLALVLAGRGPRLWRESGLAVGLALLGGHVSSQLSAGARPAWPPTQVLHWIPPAAAVAVALGLLARREGRLGLLRWLAHGALFSATTWFLVRPIARRSWSEPGAIGFVLVLGGLSLLAWWGLDRARPGAPFAPVASLVTAGAASAVCLLSHSAKVAQLLGSLAAGLAVLGIATLVGARTRMGGAPAAVVTVLLLGLLLDARFYVRVPLDASLLLGASLLTAHAGRLPLVGILGKRRQRLLAVLLAGAPALVALGLSWLRHEPPGYY